MIKILKFLLFLLLIKMNLFNNIEFLAKNNNDLVQVSKDIEPLERYHIFRLYQIFNINYANGFDLSRFSENEICLSQECISFIIVNSFFNSAFKQCTTNIDSSLWVEKIDGRLLSTSNYYGFFTRQSKLTSDNSKFTRFISICSTILNKIELSTLIGIYFISSFVNVSKLQDSLRDVCFKLTKVVHFVTSSASIISLKSFLRNILNVITPTVYVYGITLITLLLAPYTQYAIDLLTVMVQQNIFIYGESTKKFIKLFHLFFLDSTTFNLFDYPSNIFVDSIELETVELSLFILAVSGQWL
jgi:hypothetical protein